MNDFPLPHPYTFRGSLLARGLLRLAGWRVYFEGFPALQGVAIVYPHTSNWDFVVMILAKWAVGVQVRFWGKDSLFRVPLFGAWMRWLGGVPVVRTASGGVTAQAVAVFQEHKQRGAYFWLGLAPEGTRKRIPGLRSGFYRTAVGADVPVAVIRLDYGTRTVDITHFLRMTGDAHTDLARMAAIYAGVQGRIPANAAPVQLLDTSIPRADTIIQ